MTVTEYRKGQIWLDDDHVTVRRVTSKDTHDAFYSGGNVNEEMENYLIDGNNASLVYNPPEPEPEYVEFEGYLIGPHEENKYATWELDKTPRFTGVYHTGVNSAEEAWEKIAEFSMSPVMRRFIPALIALAHFIEKEN